MIKKICEKCNKPFEAVKTTQRFCNQKHFDNCPICGKQYEIKNRDNLSKPAVACSYKCRTLRTQQTSLTKYGIRTPGNTPSARQKSKDTMRAKYGVEYTLQSPELADKVRITNMKKYGVSNAQQNEYIRDKTRATNVKKYGSTTYLTSEQGSQRIKEICRSRYGTEYPICSQKVRDKIVCTNYQRYGVSNPACTTEIRNKMKHTSRVRYGTDYPTQSPVVKNKMRDTFIRNYGVDNCSKHPQVIEKIKQTFYKNHGCKGSMGCEEIREKIKETNMKRYGVPYYVMLNNISKSSGKLSKTNLKFSKKMDDNEIPNVCEFPLETKSFDINIPPAKTLIEINPSYTHSVVGNHYNMYGKHKDYHKDKSKLAEKYGYRCIHIWDWDDPNKVIGMLSPTKTIYSGFTIQVSNYNECIEFINTYQIAEHTEVYSTDIYYIIKYKSKIICLEVFRKTECGYRLIIKCGRFYRVVPHQYKIVLDKFIQDYQPNAIWYKSDVSKESSDLIENIGFTKIGELPPQLIWSKGRHALIDNGTIIFESMLENRWLPVYNCGYYVYRWKPNVADC